MNAQLDPKNTYLVIEEMIIGPFTDSEVFHFLQEGQVGPHTLAYRPNHPAARPLEKVPELAYGLVKTDRIQSARDDENWTLISAISLILMGLIAITLLTGGLRRIAGSSDDLSTVYSGQWKNKKDVVIGLAVERYLQNVSWEKKILATGEHFVEVSGEGIWRNKKAKIQMHFYVDDSEETFDLDAVIVDGYLQNSIEAEAILDAIVNSYHPL